MPGQTGEQFRASHPDIFPSTPAPAASTPSRSSGGSGGGGNTTTTIIPATSVTSGGSVNVGSANYSGSAIVPGTGMTAQQYANVYGTGTSQGTQYVSPGGFITPYSPTGITSSTPVSRTSTGVYTATIATTPTETMAGVQRHNAQIQAAAVQRDTSYALQARPITKDTFGTQPTIDTARQSFIAGANAIVSPSNSFTKGITNSFGQTSSITRARESFITKVNTSDFGKPLAPSLFPSQPTARESKMQISLVPGLRDIPISPLGTSEALKGSTGYEVLFAKESLRYKDIAIAERDYGIASQGLFTTTQLDINAGKNYDIALAGYNKQQSNLYNTYYNKLLDLQFSKEYEKGLQQQALSMKGKEFSQLPILQKAGAYGLDIYSGVSKPILYTIEKTTGIGKDLFKGGYNVPVNPTIGAIAGGVSTKLLTLTTIGSIATGITFARSLPDIGKSFLTSPLETTKQVAIGGASFYLTGKALGGLGITPPELSRPQYVSLFKTGQPDIILLESGKPSGGLLGFEKIESLRTASIKEPKFFQEKFYDVTQGRSLGKPSDFLSSKQLYGIEVRRLGASLGGEGSKIETLSIGYEKLSPAIQGAVKEQFGLTDSTAKQLSIYERIQTKKGSSEITPNELVFQTKRYGILLEEKDSIGKSISLEFSGARGGKLLSPEIRTGLGTGNFGVADIFGRTGKGFKLSEEYVSGSKAIDFGPQSGRNYFDIRLEKTFQTRGRPIEGSVLSIKELKSNAFNPKIIPEESLLSKEFGSLGSQRSVVRGISKTIREPVIKNVGGFKVTLEGQTKVTTASFGIPELPFKFRRGDFGSEIKPSDIGTGPTTGAGSNLVYQGLNIQLTKMSQIGETLKNIPSKIKVSPSPINVLSGSTKGIQINIPSLKIGSIQRASTITSQRIDLGLKSETLLKQVPQSFETLSQISSVKQITGLQQIPLQLQQQSQIQTQLQIIPNLIPTKLFPITPFIPGFPTGGFGFDNRKQSFGGDIFPNPRRRGRKAGFNIAPSFTGIIEELKMTSPLKVSKTFGVTPFQTRGLFVGKRAKKEKYFKLVDF